MLCKSFLKESDENVSVFIYNMKGYYTLIIIINTIEQSICFIRLFPYL